MFARRHAARARKYRAIDVHRLFQRYKCRTWTVEPAQQEPWPQDSAQLWIAKVQARRVAKAALHHGPQQHLCGTRDHRVHGVLCGEKGGGNVPRFCLEGWEMRGTQIRASSSPLLHAGVKSRQRPTQAAVLQVQSDTPVLDSVKRTLWLCVAASSGVRRAGRPCPTFPLLPNSADVHKDCNTQIRQK